MLKFTGINGLLVLAIASVVAGCATVKPAQSGAEKVIVTEGPLAKHCKLKGQVSVNDVAHPMNTPSQHMQLKSEEFDSLRAQAQELGANTVLLSASSGMFDKKHWSSKSTHSTQATHVFTGKAYWCPAS